MTATVEEDMRRYDERQFARMHQSILAFVNRNMDYLFDNFYRQELKPKDIARSKDEIPTIFMGILGRYKAQWEATLQRAFSVARDTAQASNTIYAKVGREIHEDVPQSPQKLFGFIRATRDMHRRWTMTLDTYIAMLFKTIPRNLDRELTKYLIKLYEPVKLYLIRGGVRRNSASVCIWCNDKVLTEDAYSFVTGSPLLSTHLYHPNCYHHVEAVPGNFRGRIYTLQDAMAAARRGVLGNLRRG